MGVGKYVSYDYELPGEDNFWHIFTNDNEPEDLIDFADGFVMTIIGPETDEMQRAVAAVVAAIDAVIDLAVKARSG